jgi:hypothetical protein
MTHGSARRTWILVIGPAEVEDTGVGPTGLRRYLLTAPHGIGTLQISCGEWVSEAELRFLGGCWFRDTFAAEVRLRAKQAA